MANIVTRAGKGSELTFAEVDSNFTGLASDTSTLFARTYAPVANIGAIPASPANGDRIEISDSTGIRGLLNVQNIPANFPSSGDISGLQVRLQYSSPLLAWQWVSYEAKAPDGRYAALASPTLTGTPVAPTATAGTNTTQLATTAFVAAAVAPLAPSASPNFTGTPSGPTATAGTNTTQLATTAFATAAANASLPLGAVIPFAGATAPAGWLKANGDTLPNGSGTVQGITADFSALYAIVGATYGAAGRLPDLRGEFVRGWDDSRGVDASRVRGSAQTDLIKQHYHNTVAGDNGGSNDNTNSQAQTDPSDFSQSGFNTRSTGWDGVNYLGGETRPRNIALLYCIKYTFFLTT